MMDHLAALVGIAVLDLAPGAVVVDQLGDTLAVMPADPDTTTGGNWSTDCWTWYDRDGDGETEWVYGPYCSTWVPFSRGSDPLYFVVSRLDSMAVDIPCPGGRARVSLLTPAPWWWAPGVTGWWASEPEEVWYREWFWDAPGTANVPVDRGDVVLIRGICMSGSAYVFLKEWR